MYDFWNKRFPKMYKKGEIPVLIVYDDDIFGDGSVIRKSEHLVTHSVKEKKKK